MSSFFRCFSRHQSGSLSLEKGNNGESCKERKKWRVKCKCKCPCAKCASDIDADAKSDHTDGKSFSKTLHISSGRKCKRHTSCCESTSSDGNPPSQYSTLPSPSASVDPTGTPFIMPSGEEDLPGKSYMPVSKEDPFYNMNHARRGKAVIFNFDRWDNTNIPLLELSPRKGSEKDKKDLAKTLSRLDFEVEEHDNVKHLTLWAVLERIRKEDHTNADCLVVVVMTHGEKNTVYMRDGTQIPINLIWENFEANKCPSLAGKPKIFIVQACRGKQYDSGTILHPNANGARDANNDLDRSDVTDSSTFSYVIPNAADVIVAFSCPLGHYSWRHPERGSWFIQAICKIFNRHAYDMNIQELFTTVAREVALNYQSNTMNVDTHNKKQVTSTSSTLIRSVVFRPKIPHFSHQPLPLPLEQEIALVEDKEVMLTSIGTVTIEGQGQDIGAGGGVPEVTPLTLTNGSDIIHPHEETFGQINGSVAV